MTSLVRLENVRSALKCSLVNLSRKSVVIGPDEVVCEATFHPASIPIIDHVPGFFDRDRYKDEEEEEEEKND